MKQVVEETNYEIGRLKSVISEYENKTKDLSTLREELETVRSENISLRDVISQNGQAMQEKDRTLSLILEALGHMDVGLESDTVDPVKKLEKLGKRCKDLLSDLATMEQESRKSKRYDELLVVEMNEVQERNDVLQEELAKASTDLSELSRERDYYQAEAMEARSSLDQLNKDLFSLESAEIEKDSKLLCARRNFSLLLDACMTTVGEIDNFKTELGRCGFASDGCKVNISPKLSEFTEETLVFSSEEGIKDIQEQLFSAVKDLISLQAETSEANLKDLSSTIQNLHKELQEKDIQGERNCMQLVQQIKEAEAIANKYSQELQLSQGYVDDLQRKIQVMEEEHNESLLQALDEEEIQMEDMRNKIGEHERALQQKDEDSEKLDISGKKALKKLSMTVSKSDELHLLSENLLSELENLQSQLQERDQEVSFLRQEVTRCTKDALLASQASNKMSSNEVSDLLAWLATMFSGVQTGESNIGECKEMLKEQISCAVSELEDLRVAVRNGDMLLQLEKSKVEELTSKEQFLESSLCEKESQLDMLRGDVGQARITSPEIVDLEPMVCPAAAPQVRSLRKSNNEHVAIPIDVDQNNEKLEEEDDDKAHGFKSLTTSRVVPQFTRPVTDLVDGLWVTCDRTLMRQPVLRLGVMIYWAFLHALLAAYVV